MFFLTIDLIFMSFRTLTRVTGEKTTLCHQTIKLQIPILTWLLYSNSTQIKCVQEMSSPKEYKDFTD